MTALRPVGLRTERTRDPVGIDEPAPLFSWRLAGDGRHRAQSAYRLIVAADVPPAGDAGAVAWDSGWVGSAQCADVSYAGPPLLPGQRYAWQVQVADERGDESELSEPATFETGLLDEADWEHDRHSAWIQGPRRPPGNGTALDLDLAGPGRDVAWIWLPAGGAPAAAVLLGTSFEVPPGGRVLRALLLADSVGGEPRAFINGHAVRPDGGDGAEAASAVRIGANTLVIAASPAPDGQGAVVARLEIWQEGRSPVTVVTDSTWRGSAAAAPGSPVPGRDGWGSADPRDWAPAESKGLHGSAPFGRSRLAHRPVTYLRTEFNLDVTAIRRARLYATALGVYEARVNGHPVADDRLAPGWTDYRRRVPYQTYDVTRLLRPGGNAVAVLLADGWYAGNICWFGTCQYGTSPAFRARLEIEDAAGQRTVITTDESWRAGEGPIRYADLQNGEVIDRRYERAGWDLAGFGERDWHRAAVAAPPHGRLEAQAGPAIRRQLELPPRDIQRTSDGRHIIDFGQNLVGWLRLRLRGGTADRVLVRHAEALDHTGEPYTAALRTARATDEFILRGDGTAEEFEPTFTVHGFRYAEISGYPHRIGSGDVVAVVAYADMEPTGDFTTSDPRLNRLQQNIVWSQRGNFLSVPTDCPQRDERLGWTGDAQAFAETAAFNYDVRRFFRKWLRDLRDGQRGDGAIPNVAPDVLSPHAAAADPPGSAGVAGWGDAIVIVPYEMLRAYGDRRLARESIDAIESWLGYLRADSDGLLRPAAGFGDWLAPCETPKDLVATAFFARAAQLAAELARELGQQDRAATWDRLYADVRAAFRGRFLRADGRLTSATQAAYVLALHFGLFDPGEAAAAAGYLVADIESRGWHLSTGFLATPYLLPVLSGAGRADAAFRLLLQDSLPSWLYPVVHGGATTMWERWDAWSDVAGFQDPAMTSFNHYAYGAVGAWLYQHVGGLAAAGHGYRHIRVRPRPCAGITWATTALTTAFGRTRAAWRVRGDDFELDVDVPVNATAEVWLPSADLTSATESGLRLGEADVLDVARLDGQLVVRTGSGSYRFRVRSTVTELGRAHHELG